MSILAIYEYTYITYWNRIHFVMYIMNTSNKVINLKKIWQYDFWVSVWHIRAWKVSLPATQQKKLNKVKTNNSS